MANNKSGRPVPIWFQHDDLLRLEEAAALSGYRHLSKYIRDRAMGRGDHRDTFHAGNSMQSAAWQHEVDGRLADIERNQQASITMQTALLSMMCSRTTTGDVNELRASLATGNSTEEILSRLMPELADIISRIRSGEGE